MTLMTIIRDPSCFPQTHQPSSLSVYDLRGIQYQTFHGQHVRVNFHAGVLDKVRTQGRRSFAESVSPYYYACAASTRLGPYVKQLRQ